MTAMFINLLPTWEMGTSRQHSGRGWGKVTSSVRDGRRGRWGSVSLDTTRSKAEFMQHGYLCDRGYTYRPLRGSVVTFWELL